MKTTQTSAKRTGATSKGFSAEERDAMKERARELKSAKGAKGKMDGAAEMLAKIAALAQPERGIAEGIHALVMATAPGLEPRTWYGMPAWYKDGKVLCHFVSATKFKTRYATLGFSETAKLDDGNMFPTSYAIKKLTPAEETRITALVKKAVG